MVLVDLGTVININHIVEKRLRKMSYKQYYAQPLDNRFMWVKDLMAVRSGHNGPCVNI